MAKGVGKITIIINCDLVNGAPVRATRSYTIADGDLTKNQRPQEIKTPDFGKTVVNFCKDAFGKVKTAESIT